MSTEEAVLRRESLAAAGTFLTRPTATIYFDGLIMLAHNAEARLFQAGIHTQAEHHSLQIEVFEAGNPDALLFPTDALPFDGSHANVSAVAPLWLHVDSGNGHPPAEFSAAVNRPDDTRFSQSFGHILDFEGAGLYNRRLTFSPTTFALLNLPHGEFYSAQNITTELKHFAQNESFENAVRVRDIIMSTLAAADIDVRSEPGGPNGDPPPVERSIVLEQENPRRELFRFRLEEGKRYIINLVNGPVMGDAHAGHAGHAGHTGPVVTHAEHFLQFYEMFALLPDEKKFLVNLPPSGGGSADAPPCNVGRAGSSGRITETG